MCATQPCKDTKTAFLLLQITQKSVNFEFSDAKIASFF